MIFIYNSDQWFNVKKTVKFQMVMTFFQFLPLFFSGLLFDKSILRRE